jgi:uncharacterized protein
MKPNPVVWILADDKAGDVNQCIGVAEALGYGYIRKNIAYTRISKLPNSIRNKTLIGIDKAKSDALLPPYPDILIGAGRKTAPVAAYIKARHPACFMVQLMWPHYPLDCFDIIAVPEHDAKGAKRSNCITTLGSPHRVTPKILAEAALAWEERFASFPKPHISVIVGGTTKYSVFTADHAKLLGEKASELAASLGGSLLVTTSRRTGAEAEAALRSAINVPYFFHNWESGGENPFFGLLASSEVIIVTGDSMSMCSEAAATGKPVMIFAPADITPEKFQRLHQALYDSRNAAPFPGEVPVTLTALPNAAEAVVQAIRERYKR